MGPDPGGDIDFFPPFRPGMASGGLGTQNIVRESMLLSNFGVGCTLWPVNKKFQWTGQGLKFLKKFRFGLEWPPAASGPQKSTMNRIFGRIFSKFHQIPL